MRYLNKKGWGWNLTSKQLKKHLFENPTLIITILEELDCHHIKHVRDKRITSALPDGDNTTSVQVILLDDGLGTVVHTRADYKGGDIFEFASYIKGCSFRNSLMFVCRLLNLEYTRDYVKPTTNETYGFLQSFNRIGTHNDDVENIVIDESTLNDYIRCAHQMFLDDNLSVDSQYKFGIHYDLHQHRILTPIRDTDGCLITFKGRTVCPDYKEKDVMKYIAYYDYYARLLLYGYYENYWDIITSDEIILVESEKAVIQADSYGTNNVVALSKKKISDEQLFKLISLNKDIVLALDKDVLINELEVIAEEFKGLCRVYAVYDTNNVLEGKQSPLDRGKDVWNELYENKIRII